MDTIDVEAATLEITENFSNVAAREFQAAKTCRQGELLDWSRQLRVCSDGDLKDKAESAIYTSALMASFRGNYEHEHAKATMCYDEAIRRHREKGHSTECRGRTLYEIAHHNVMRQEGHSPGPLSQVCTCGMSA